MVRRLILAAACLLASCSGRGGEPVGAPRGEGPGPAPAEGAPVPAPALKVELYVPLGPECHQRTLALVKKWAEDHPGEIEIVILAMGNPRKDREMRERGISCATVLVGGKSEFDLPDGQGGTRRAVFSHKPNEPESTYRSEDVIAAIEAARKGGRAGG